jgi:hypothetical protein
MEEIQAFLKKKILGAKYYGIYDAELDTVQRAFKRQWCRRYFAHSQLG